MSVELDTLIDRLDRLESILDDARREARRLVARAEDVADRSERSLRAELEELCGRLEEEYRSSLADGLAEIRTAEHRRLELLTTFDRDRAEAVVPTLVRSLVAPDGGGFGRCAETDDDLRAEGPNLRPAPDFR